MASATSSLAELFMQQRENLSDGLVCLGRLSLRSNGFACLLAQVARRRSTSFAMGRAS